MGILLIILYSRSVETILGMWLMNSWNCSPTQALNKLAGGCIPLQNIEVTRWQRFVSGLEKVIDWFLVKQQAYHILPYLTIFCEKYHSFLIPRGGNFCQIPTWPLWALHGLRWAGWFGSCGSPRWNCARSRAGHSGRNRRGFLGHRGSHWFGCCSRGGSEPTPCVQIMCKMFIHYIAVLQSVSISVAMIWCAYCFNKPAQIQHAGYYSIYSKCEHVEPELPSSITSSYCLNLHRRWWGVQ